MLGIVRSNKTPLDQTEITDEIKGKTGGKGANRIGGRPGGRWRTLADRSRPAGGAAEKGPLHRAYGVQRGEGKEEAPGEDGTQAPRPLPRLTPRVGPEGHGPVALHQMRPLEAVFVFESAMWQRGWAARGTGVRGVSSRALAPDVVAARQQQGAEKRPSSGLGTPSPGSRHLEFWKAQACGRGRGAGAEDGQQGAR